MIWVPAGPTVTRADCWSFGMQVREALIWKYMAERGEAHRPLVKDVVDDLIRDGLGARLREEPLPLDRFAQTEVVKGRIEITVNSRIREMPQVKDVEGVGYISKWHEIIHVPQDLGGRDLARRLSQAALPGVEMPPPRVAACSVTFCRGGPRGRERSPSREFVAENAALAAAIAGPDLRRCPAFLRFLALRPSRGQLSGWAWSLLDQTAAFLGVSRAALVRYLVHRGFVRVGRSRGRPQLMPTSGFDRGVDCLEPDSGPSKLIA
jgi:hypothetical protein